MGQEEGKAEHKPTDGERGRSIARLLPQEEGQPGGSVGRCNVALKALRYSSSSSSPPSLEPAGSWSACCLQRSERSSRWSMSSSLYTMPFPTCPTAGGSGGMHSLRGHG